MIKKNITIGGALLLAIFPSYGMESHIGSQRANDSQAYHLMVQRNKPVQDLQLGDGAGAVPQELPASPVGFELLESVDSVMRNAQGGLESPHNFEEMSYDQQLEQWSEDGIASVLSSIDKQINKIQEEIDSPRTSSASAYKEKISSLLRRQDSLSVLRDKFENKKSMAWGLLLSPDFSVDLRNFVDHAEKSAIDPKILLSQQNTGEKQ